MKRSAWFMPVIIIGACLSCLAVPFVLAAAGAGAIGATLAGLGLGVVPAVALTVLALCLAGGVLAMRWRKPACDPSPRDGSV